MIGIRGAVNASPSAAPTTSIVRLARRTLRNTESAYHDEHTSAGREVWLFFASMVAPIRLTIPGTLRYRAIAVRAVAEAARLVSASARLDPKDPLANDVRHPFDTAV